MPRTALDARLHGTSGLGLFAKSVCAVPLRRTSAQPARRRQAERAHGRHSWRGPKTAAAAARRSQHSGRYPRFQSPGPVRPFSAPHGDIGGRRVGAANRHDQSAAPNDEKVPTPSDHHRHRPRATSTSHTSKSRSLLLRDRNEPARTASPTPHARPSRAKPPSRKNVTNLHSEC
jgi:hypothetical protein